MTFLVFMNHDVFDGDILDSVDCVGVSDGVDGVVDIVDGGAGDSCCLWFDLRTESSLRAAKTHKKRDSRKTASWIKHCGGKKTALIGFQRRARLGRWQRVNHSSDTDTHSLTDTVK